MIIKSIQFSFFLLILFRKVNSTVSTISTSQSIHQHLRERRTGTVCAPIASQLIKTAPNAQRSNATQLNQQKVNAIVSLILRNTTKQRTNERN